MTTLTPERIAELRAIYELDRGTTHWVGCETEHARCAMYRALDAYEALQAERDRLRAALEEIVNAPPGHHDVRAATIARKALAGGGK